VATSNRLKKEPTELELLEEWAKRNDITWTHVHDGKKRYRAAHVRGENVTLVGIGKTLKDCLRMAQILLPGQQHIVDSEEANTEVKMPW
jgi:hypothetical protein